MNMKKIEALQALKKEEKIQLLIDGTIDNLVDLYKIQVSLELDLTADTLSFLEQWSKNIKEMPLDAVLQVAEDTDINAIMLIACLDLGVNKITVSDFLHIMAEHPNYEEVKKDFLNYIKHFL